MPHNRGKTCGGDQGDPGNLKVVNPSGGVSGKGSSAELEVCRISAVTSCMSYRVHTTRVSRTDTALSKMLKPDNREV